MIVTWDSDKNRINIKKRHLPLSLGSVILNDPERIEKYDDKHSTQDEDRWQTIGCAGEMLFMVYTERGEIPHIISIRLADAEEKRLYYGNRDLYEGWYRVNP